MITRNFHVRDQPEPRPATPPAADPPVRPGLLRRVLAALDRLRGR